MRISNVYNSLLVLLCLSCGSAPQPEPNTPPQATTQSSELPPAAPEVSSAAPQTSAEPAPAASSTSPLSATVEHAVAAADRSADDRTLDAGRHPVELFSFFGIAPGMRVAELAAGGGYTAELLARIVGPSGKVYGQNSKFLLQRYAEKPWTERLQKPVMANVVRFDRDFDEPLPSDVKDLDAVLLLLFYHDTVWMKADREKMNRTIFAALKPGGVFGVIDHSAKAGTGVADTESLHRIEESIVKDEILRAGFVLDGEADFMRHAEDTRDWSASPRFAGERRGQSDRFVLRFKKPAAATPQK